MLLLPLLAFAQVQKGYVRTVGRPDNRKGDRIPGITIRVSGLHNAFVSGADGTFDFDLGGGKTEYMFTNILDNKFQYELQEKELLGRKEPVSTTVDKEIVMVSLKEKQAIENKKREQIESQYQRDMKRLNDQLEQEEITNEKYREELQALQEAFDKRDMLITDLTEHFASIDYAKLSEEQVRISALLEDGDLLTADSIINAKGDVTKRVKEILAFRAENTVQQGILNKKIEDERAGTSDLIKDCESKFLIFEQQHRNDYAAHYLELLVSLDTTNVENLLRTGMFIKDYLAQYDRALEYFNQALKNAQKHYGEDHHSYVATSYNNIGSIYNSQGDYARALEYYTKALEIRKKVFGEDHPYVAEIFVMVHSSYEMTGSNKEFERLINKTLSSMAYTLTCIDGDTPAKQQGMSGEYIVLKFEDWTIQGKMSLMNKNGELHGKPKTIVVMKDGVISEHFFENAIGAQISCKYVGEKEKQRMMDAYQQWEMM